MNNYEKAKEEGINNWEHGLAEVSDDGGFEYTLSFLSSFAEKIKEGVEKDLKGTKEYEFGDIFTNGINYWMFTGKHEPLRPAVLDRDKSRVEYLVGYYYGDVSDIKPYAKFIGNFANKNLSPSKEDILK